MSCNAFLGFGCAFLLNTFAWADKVTLNAGTVFEGIIVQQDDQEVLLLRDYGTQWIPASMIQSIAIDEASRPKPLPEKGAALATPLPAWGKIVARAAKTSWGERLRQIPATVIDRGVFKNVPYISFRCGKEYELNIYGDLDVPACVEVGLYGSLLGKEYAQHNAIDFMASLLTSDEHRKFLKGLVRKSAKEVRDGITMELTPETADDSYGGWWVSIYSKVGLEAARATDAELKAITISNEGMINTNAVPPWLASLRNAPPTTSPTPTAGANSGTIISYPAVSSYVYTPSSRQGGSVFVNGYTRRNGTYVHSFSRSAPRR